VSTEVPTSAPTVYTGADETVEEFLARILTDDGALQRAGSPQAEALQSITTNFPDLDPNNGPQDRTDITQTYALATLYYSTNGTDWAKKDGWPGPTPPCGDAPWYGVVCDGSGKVVNVNLGANDLYGELPSEVRGLTNLGTCLGI
jgi:hypothetical protein